MAIIHDEVEFNMNKLVVLKDFKKDSFKKSKKEININIDKKDSLNKPEFSEKEYKKFEEKFFTTDSREKTEESKKYNAALKELFLIENSQPVIDFMNYLYDDYLSSQTKISVDSSGKASDGRLKIVAVDDYRRFEYNVFLNACDKNNIAIYIIKKQSEKKFENVVNFQKQKNMYKKGCDNEENLNNMTKNTSLCKMIVICSEVEVPEKFTFKKDKETYKFDIIKGWKYDTKKMADEKIYLLLPLKIFDLRKMKDSLKENEKTDVLLVLEYDRLIKSIRSSLERIKDKTPITAGDICYIVKMSKALFSLIENKK